ncbi:unnamed protein product, partial [marine sediment metagenome]
VNTADVWDSILLNPSATDAIETGGELADLQVEIEEGNIALVESEAKYRAEIEKTKES